MYRGPTSMQEVMFYIAVQVKFRPLGAARQPCENVPVLFREIKMFYRNISFNLDVDGI